MTAPTDEQMKKARRICDVINHPRVSPRLIIAQALADIAAQTERETVERCKTIIKERAEQWKRAGKPPDGHTDETVMRRRAMTDAAKELCADILVLAPAPAGLV
jgi:hypothetical protein